MKRHTVGEIMTRDVVSVRDRADYKEIVEALVEHALSAVPVVDDTGRVLGVVSEADLLHKVEFAGEEPPMRLFERRRARSARTKAGADFAADLMTVPAVMVGPDETVSTAAKLMESEHVKRLPVVDDECRLVGIVSRGDILRLFLRTDDDIQREVSDEVLLRTLWIDPTDITVTVERGVVTLTGRVEQRSSIPLIVRFVQSVAGVVDVVDDITYDVDDAPRGERPESMPIVA